ncbi:hypothetical protein [Peterkaempfera griseoplana]|nr:hypothetical protein [Peterkaempfera griseoplana]
MAPPEPIVQPVRFTVNCLPGDGIDSHVFGIDASTVVRVAGL